MNQALNHEDNLDHSEDEFYFMANLWPEDTGLPFIIWISERGFAQHDVRIKVAQGGHPGNWVSVGIRPDVHVAAGKLKPHDLALVRTWINLNRQIIIDYWDNKISTKQATNSIKKI